MKNEGNGKANYLEEKIYEQRPQTFYLPFRKRSNDAVKRSDALCKEVTSSLSSIVEKRYSSSLGLTIPAPLPSSSSSNPPNSTSSRIFLSPKNAYWEASKRAFSGKQQKTKFNYKKKLSLRWYSAKMYISTYQYAQNN